MGISVRHSKGRTLFQSKIGMVAMIQNEEGRYMLRYGFYGRPTKLHSTMHRREAISFVSSYLAA